MKWPGISPHRPICEPLRRHRQDMPRRRQQIKPTLIQRLDEVPQSSVITRRGYRKTGSVLHAGPYRMSFNMLEVPTIDDVARAAGVSIATVSRVLSPGMIPHPVRAATAERVRAAARRLNFIPS